MSEKDSPHFPESFFHFSTPFDGSANTLDTERKRSLCPNTSTRGSSLPRYHGIFDTHAHYNDHRFDDDRETLLPSLPSLGVEEAIVVGYDIPSSEKAVEIASTLPYLHAAAGFHPENLEEYGEEGIAKLREILKNEKIIAIGEIGLDYHWKEFGPTLQEKAFRRQMKLADELNLPVIIHSREATADTLRILSDYKGVPGVLHCFSGSAETAKTVTGWGFYIGFTGVLTFKNSRKAVEAVEAAPIDKLLLETDCPYMAPEPWRGKRSCSPMIQSVAEKMAEIKGVSPQEMIDIAAANARRLFRL